MHVWWSGKHIPVEQNQSIGLIMCRRRFNKFPKEINEQFLHRPIRLHRRQLLNGSDWYVCWVKVKVIWDSCAGLAREHNHFRGTRDDEWKSTIIHVVYHATFRFAFCVLNEMLFEYPNEYGNLMLRYDTIRKYYLTCTMTLAGIQQSLQHGP